MGVSLNISEVKCRVAGKYYTLSGKIVGCKLILSGIHVHVCTLMQQFHLSEQYTATFIADKKKIEPKELPMQLFNSP